MGAKVIARRQRASGPGRFVLLGCASSATGIGRGLRMMAKAYADQGIACQIADVTDVFGHGSAVDVDSCLVIPENSTLISHLAPPDFLRAIGSGVLSLPRRFNLVGYWAWETPDAPKTWEAGARWFDEVWCPSSFAADAIRGVLPPGTPIQVVPHPIGVVAPGTADRARFGLPSGAFIFLAGFDHRSSLSRKNPYGALEAFRRSGLGSTGTVELLIKEAGAELNPDAARELAERVAATPGARLLSGELDTETMERLCASVNAVVSLHRAEGYGLFLAEAMACGLPVIATGWSGNMDFMNTENAGIVRYDLIAINDPTGIYRDSVWAEPDLDHAAQLMQQCVHSAEWRTQIARAAKQRMSSGVRELPLALRSILVPDERQAHATAAQ